jgi:hypothetical protein
MSYRDLLEEIELKVNLDRESDSIARFVIAVCHAIDLPVVASEGLDVAARYVDDDASEDELERARVNCWISIKGRDWDLADNSVAATRAALCAMYPRSWPDDRFEGLAAFADFATAAGVAPAHLTAALRTAFADVLRKNQH